jgi:hypothetical protein
MQYMLLHTGAPDLDEAWDEAWAALTSWIEETIASGVNIEGQPLGLDAAARRDPRVSWAIAAHLLDLASTQQEQARRVQPQGPRPRRAPSGPGRAARPRPRSRPAAAGQLRPETRGSTGEGGGGEQPRRGEAAPGSRTRPETGQ